ncbi:MAG: trypsin-like peptidase domain-containing protein [bacterium]
MEIQNKKSGILVSMLIVGILSSVTTIAVLGFVVYKNKQKVFSTIAALVQVPAPQYTVQEVAAPAPAVDTTPKGPTDLTIPEVVSKVNPSVVSIEVSADTMLGTQVVGGGSGFFVSSDGLVLTNRHVVDIQGASFVVVTSTGKRYKATVKAKDAVLDIAMLQVTGKNFTPVTLGNSDNLELGQGVVAIGFALGQFKNSISSGVVSGLARSIVAGSEYSSELLDKVIQTDAPINPGNSGGPLLNLRGEVVGVNVAVAQGSQSIGFALPINSVRTVIDSVKKTGTIVRPYVGIYFNPVSKGIQIATDDGSDPIVPNSPAQKAGLMAGDIITKIDGTTLTINTDFAGIIRQKKVGQKCIFHIIRGDIEKDVKVVLEKAS